ncbi:hypothetical protein Asi02nite_59800 [Asanoa siamensis]|uniref:Uncharacterized protein n=1 Tax=Asanoa siamensis TaxID=926357 RepID=A0ABQ4D042_9ACTN|nr:hypothetical protein Asi02nite_59800 [Asanoa siamensis]
MANAAVTVTVSDGSGNSVGCTNENLLATVQITLPEPLADRVLIDGHDDTRRPVYREADEPRVPGGSDGWPEVPARFVAPSSADSVPPGSWHQSYTRPGGPDIRVKGRPLALESGSAAVGGFWHDLSPRDGPRGGKRMSLSTFREILGASASRERAH